MFPLRILKIITTKKFNPNNAYMVVSGDVNVDEIDLVTNYLNGKVLRRRFLK